MLFMVISWALPLLTPTFFAEPRSTKKRHCQILKGKIMPFHSRKGQYSAKGAAARAVYFVKLHVTLCHFATLCLQLAVIPLVHSIRFVNLGLKIV